MQSAEASDTAPKAKDDVQIRVSYTRSSTSAERRATFANGETVRVRAGRVRAYPGLPSEAPPTLPFYKLAAEELPEGGCVLDVGCGSGLGTRLLTQRGRKVIGLDESAEAVSFARHFAGDDAQIMRTDAALSLPALAANAAVFVDVLAHMAAPFDALTAVHERLLPGSVIFVAEQAAHPEQCLRAPVRRAFSQRALASLLAATGFRVTKWHSVGTFLACTAEYVEDPAVAALGAATRTQEPKQALALYEEAKKSQNPHVVLEALLGAAETSISIGDGDGACQSLFAARTLAPEDPRPCVGLARIALLTNSFEDAKGTAELAIELDPTEASAHAMLALARDATQESSIYTWRLAVNLSPDSAGYVDLLLDAAAAAADGKLGIHAAERLRAYDACDASTKVIYAKALLIDGRESDARYEIEVALKEEPDNAALSQRLMDLRAAFTS